MTFRNETILLRRIVSTSHSAWLRGAEQQGELRRRLYIVISGYEKRSTHWIVQTLEKLPAAPETSYLVIGFEDFDQALSRPSNDELYGKLGLAIHRVDSRRRDTFLDLVVGELESFIGASKGDRVEVHVDYSCMPRLWYCHLPTIIEKNLRECDNVYFWYTRGIYPEAEYPTAGVDDFHVCSGRPSLGAAFRTHMFGLGFDKIRSQAIWSIIDPQNLVCFYADPATKPEYVKRVSSDNEVVISNANYVFSVPIDDFVFTYSKIAAVASEFSGLGDVIIVPDGPKPLILAASLVPVRLSRHGITCLHVTRRRTESCQPVDVGPTGEPVGFSFAGSRI